MLNLPRFYCERVMRSGPGVNRQHWRATKPAIGEVGRGRSGNLGQIGHVIMKTQVLAGLVFSSCGNSIL